MNFRVDLEIFRGPLDLLLYLVRKHEVEIVDIPIATITEQFLPLAEGKPTDSVRTDAEFETSVSNRMRKAATPPPTSDPSKLSASARMVRMNCPMCEKPFVEPVDSKGRVDCPHCGSSFSA